jgi:hypothetical protein
MEVNILYQKTKRPTEYQDRNAKNTEEIISILTAISVVSKRLAKKLALLGYQQVERKENKAHGRTSVPRHAG